MNIIDKSEADSVGSAVLLCFPARKEMDPTMAELLVIADDLTGALDSGVKLACKGQSVLVSLDLEDGLHNAACADVIVIDSESRHDTADVAYRKVFELVSTSCSAGIPRVYKKTDSGLRGNVGAELVAVLDASGASHLNFVPAYPKQNRTTKDGIHYVDGVPLAQSIFSTDPLNPVTKSSVSDLIHEQSDIAVTRHGEQPSPAGIVVYDCVSDDELQSIAETITDTDFDAPMAGCAGLLEMLPGTDSHFEHGEAPTLSPQLIVISGSVNKVTSAQLDAAEASGAFRRHLPIERILDGAWDDDEAKRFVDQALADGAESPIILIDTLGCHIDASRFADGAAAKAISDAASQCAALVSTASDRTVMIVGGDALAGFIEKAGASVLEPVCELFPGIVVARYTGPHTSGTIVTKSGAFGGVNLFYDIYGTLKEKVGE